MDNIFNHDAYLSRREEYFPPSRAFVQGEGDGSVLGDPADRASKEPRCRHPGQPQTLKALTPLIQLSLAVKV